jgi:mitogen-activated protein kinase kinase
LNGFSLYRINDETQPRRDADGDDYVSAIRKIYFRGSGNTDRGASPMYRMDNPPPLIRPPPQQAAAGNKQSGGGQQQQQQRPKMKLTIPKSPSMGPIVGPGGSTSDNTPSPAVSAEILAAVDTSNNNNATSVPQPVCGTQDVDSLDEEGWRAVARAGDIVELGRLGEGHGGSVMRCRLRQGTTVFALKEITTNPNPELQKQILRELQFNRSCNSPHIVKYYGTFLNEDTANIFIAMEYCGGGSLEAIYKRVRSRGGRIGEKVLAKVADGVLSGLSYLHERRIIHRDIKPQNILLDVNGQVKLCDFGVSGEVVNSLATTFTGTSYYMAPERIQGQPYSVTSDVWSLGLTVMEVAQHRFPFLPEDENTAEPLMPIELLTFIVNMPAPELKDEPEEGIRWSDAFRHFLSCCLEKDNKKRASPRQMLGHPWLVGHRSKVVRMDKFVQECWS